MCTGITIYVRLLLHCTCCLQEKSSLSESIANKESQVSTTYVLITFSETTILASLKAFIHFMVLIGNTLKNYCDVSFLCDSVDPYTAKKYIYFIYLSQWFVIYYYFEEKQQHDHDFFSVFILFLQLFIVCYLKLTNWFIFFCFFSFPAQLTQTRLCYMQGI